MFYGILLHLNDTQIQKIKLWLQNQKKFLFLEVGFLYLELSSASSRGTCQLLWMKPRTRRIPAREWMLFMVRAWTTHHRTTHIHRAWICNLGLKVKSNPLRRKSTHLAYSQRTMLLVRPVSGSSPPSSLLDLIYCNRRRRTSLLRWANFTTRPGPPVILTH